MIHYSCINTDHARFDLHPFPYFPQVLVGRTDLFAVNDIHALVAIRHNCSSVCCINMSPDSLSTSSRSASIDSTCSPSTKTSSWTLLRRMVYFALPHFEDDEHNEVLSHRPAFSDLSQGREPHMMSKGLADNKNCYNNRGDLPRTTDHCSRPIVRNFGFADKPLPSPPLMEIIKHELEQNERGNMGRCNARSLVLMEGETVEEVQKLLMPPPLDVGRKYAPNSSRRARSLSALPEQNIVTNGENADQPHPQLKLSTHKQPGSVRKARLAAEARLAIAGCYSSSRHGPIRSTTSTPSLHSPSPRVWWSALASSPNEEAFVTPRRAPSPPTKKGSKHDYSAYTSPNLSKFGPPLSPPPPRSPDRRRPTWPPQPIWEDETTSLAKEAGTQDKARQLDPRDQSVGIPRLPSNVARAPAAVVEALSATKCQDSDKSSGSSCEAEDRKNSGNGRRPREKLQNSHVEFAPRPCSLPRSSANNSNPALSGGKSNISRTWNGVEPDSARVETILEGNPSDSRRPEDSNPDSQRQPLSCDDDEETDDDNSIQDHLAAEPNNIRRARLPPPNTSFLVTKSTSITHHHQPSCLRGGGNSERRKRSDGSTSTDSSGNSNGEAAEQRSRFVPALFTRLTDSERGHTALWWLAGGRVGKRKRVPTVDELRERRRVEREERKGVGFWGTVLGVKARHKGRGEAEEDEKVGREEQGEENAEETDESEGSEEERADEEENEGEEAVDDGSANDEKKR